MSTLRNIINNLDMACDISLVKCKSLSDPSRTSAAFHLGRLCGFIFAYQSADESLEDGHDALSVARKIEHKANAMKKPTTRTANSYWKGYQSALVEAKNLINTEASHATQN